MLKKRKLIIRAISTALSLSFLLSDISYSAPQIDAFRINSPKPIDVISADISRFEAPLEFSALREFRAGRKDKPIIIHIQDAHSNYSGQRNLADTLDFLM